ncbi:spindle assembly abnormal protein 6 homolog [Sinocyclocheilus grahami]|uniref:spindle assembly abnormal protein 6 homolog n=1 Tax=Sinocyclocheilus grahami TaxID=75366 RepID=UPI0007AD0244|nr:PREDICTED: spindle assembly abnormal protein 6 homolog [Sinocyclocheilus grahami]
MTELLFNKRLQVLVKNRDTDERRSFIRISIELQPSSNPVHRKDLVVRLTDDTDLYFLYNLVISEEDFQSLKVQQGLLIDFTSFPQKCIDLLEQCIFEQDKENPRFLLQLTSASSAFDHSPSNLNIVETNAFKHLTHLSLKLLPGSDTDIKKYLAACLSTVKEEKQQLEQKLRKTEEDLTRRLNYAQQTLSEKSRELDKLRSEWTSQTTSLSSRHMQDLTAEREKALEVECQRSEQQVLSLRRENSTLDAECHEKERLVNQLQTRVAVLEQEIKDKEQLVLRTKEVLEATQQQKNSVEGNVESKQVQISKLETAVQSLSEELIKRKQETLGMFETAAAGLRTGSVPHNMLDSKGFPSSLGHGFPITSTINSKYPLPLSCVSSGPRSVLSAHNQTSGPKAGLISSSFLLCHLCFPTFIRFFYYYVLCSHFL